LYKKVAILGLGEHQLSGIKQLANKYYTIGFDSHPNPIGIKKVHEFYNIDITKKNKILEICRKKEIIKVLSFNSEAVLKTVFWLNNKIDNSNTINKKINFISDKAKLRNFLKKNKFPYPKFYSFNNLKLINKNFFPAVVKPSIGSGSKGVFYSKNFSEFEKDFSKNRDFFKYPKKILLEEYINGTEYAADGWINNQGKVIIGAISKKKRSKLPNLFDLSLVINIENKKIKKKTLYFLQKFFEKLKIKNSPFHLEFKIQNNKIFLIDFSLRGAGFSVYSEILSEIVGQNTDQIIIDIFFNKNFTIRQSNKKKFYLLFFDKSKVQNIKNNLKKIELFKSFYKVIFYKIEKKKTNFRLGHILLQNENYKILRKEISKLKKIL
tara:strand:- start:443 stop:1579 length:1137 start_codon:yes stop_codon:yes gene_type:complete